MIDKDRLARALARSDGTSDDIADWYDGEADSEPTSLAMVVLALAVVLLVILCSARM